MRTRDVCKTARDGSACSAKNNYRVSTAVAGALICALFLLATAVSAAFARGQTSLVGKHIVGYQGWFRCNDLGLLGRRDSWQHWFREGTPSIQSLLVDFWPDTTEMSPGEGCRTGLHDANGRELLAYSSLNSKTVQRHFDWMKQYDIDGAALQRFVTHVLSPRHKVAADRALLIQIAAARAARRGFLLMYDLTGARPDQIRETIMRDWAELNARIEIADDPLYFRHSGRPIVGLWGLGFARRDLAPAEALALVSDLQHGGATFEPSSILAGVPTYWRTTDRDADPNPEWDSVYRKIDIIKPWSVGRFKDTRGAQEYASKTMHQDIQLLKSRAQQFAAVIFPGFSWKNTKGGASPSNLIPRRCGKFYFDQARAAIAAGAQILYTAMFDEVDEGTAIFKLVPSRERLPAGSNLLALDADGCELPSDHYLVIAGEATRELRARRYK